MITGNKISVSTGIYDKVNEQLNELNFLFSHQAFTRTWGRYHKESRGVENKYYGMYSIFMQLPTKVNFSITGKGVVKAKIRVSMATIRMSLFHIF